MKGTLHLIPVPLGENAVEEVLPAALLERIREIGHFVVEETRTARRFLSRAGLKGHIGEISFYELNEHTSPEVVEDYIRIIEEGCDAGLLSEAGLPAVADPGALLVSAAHRHGIRVVPYVGPSSLMMALMASGLNGQSFAFVGYIPVKPEERRNRLKALSRTVASTGQTQIIIETPYRNDSLFSDMISVCADDMRLTVAADITLPEELIVTKTVGEWKKTGITIGKRPAVFVLGK